MNKFKNEVEQNEESVRERLQIVKDGLTKWQQFFRNNRWVTRIFFFKCFVLWVCFILERKRERKSGGGGERERERERENES